MALFFFLGWTQIPSMTMQMSRSQGSVQLRQAFYHRTLGKFIGDLSPPCAFQAPSILGGDVSYRLFGYTVGIIEREN